jgi:hypothetical protein
MTPRFQSRNPSGCYRRSMRHCYAHRHLVPESYRGPFFLRNIFRFYVATARFHGMAPSRNCAKKPGSVSCHSSLRQRCRGFASCRPQAGKNSHTEVKCLNAGPDRSATPNWPGPLSYLAAPIGARCGGDAVMDHKYFHRLAISVATFFGSFRGFCSGAAPWDISVSTGTRFLSRRWDFFADPRHHET